VRIGSTLIGADAGKAYGAWFLVKAEAAGTEGAGTPDEAEGVDTSRCLIRNEVGHMHPHGDNAGHMYLSPSVHAEVVATGWGVPHSLAGQTFNGMKVSAAS
jgi:hypothetical protein